MKATSEFGLRMLVEDEFSEGEMKNAILDFARKQRKSLERQAARVAMRRRKGLSDDGKKVLNRELFLEYRSRAAV